jgi:hypothetical protein
MEHRAAARGVMQRGGAEQSDLGATDLDIQLSEPFLMMWGWFSCPPPSIRTNASIPPSAWRS